MRKYTTLIALAGLLLAAGAADAGWNEGVAAFQAGNLDQAAREFRQVVEDSPDYDGGHFMLGQVLLKQGKDQEALSHLRKAYELKSDDVSYQMALSKAYLANNRFSDAATLLKRINPGSLPKQAQEAYYQMLGVSLERSGDDGGALEAFRRLTQQTPDDADAWFRYGTSAYNAGQTDAAVNALERAVRLDGNDMQKQEAYAKALVRKARLSQGTTKRQTYETAVGVARKMVQQQNNYENLLFLGEVQLGAAQYRDAVATMEQATAKNRNDWHTYYYESQAHTLLSQYDQAAAAAQQALDRADSDRTRKRIWDQIGFAHEKQKHYDEAIEAYQRAGNQGGVERVSENKRIAEENQEIEEHNQQIKELEAERERLEKELRDIGGPPRR